MEENGDPVTDRRKNVKRYDGSREGIVFSVGQSKGKLCLLARQTEVFPIKKEWYVAVLPECKIREPAGGDAEGIRKIWRYKMERIDEA